MSKGPWKRDPISGIPIERLPEKYLTDAGEFNRSLFPDCDQFDERSIATIGSFGRVDHWKARALAPCSSYFHLHQLTDDDGRVIGYATHTQSAQWGGLEYRKAARDRKLTGKRPAWDVMPGSGRLAQPVETLVRTEQQESGTVQVWHLSGSRAGI